MKRNETFSSLHDHFIVFHLKNKKTVTWLLKTLQVSVQNVNFNARQFFLSLELKLSANFPKGNIEKKSHVIRYLANILP